MYLQQKVVEHMQKTFSSPALKGVNKERQKNKVDYTKLFVTRKQNKNVLEVKIVNLTKTGERGWRGGRIDYFLLVLRTHRGPGPSISWSFTSTFC